MTDTTEPREPAKMVANVTCELFVELTQDEREQSAIKAADLRRDINIEEADFDGFKNKHKAKIKHLTHDHDCAHGAYVCGQERREVDCEQFFDLNSKMTWYKFRDKEYQHRPMTQAEYQTCTQRPLFGDDKAPLRVVEAK